MADGQRVGYIRVSSVDQHPDRQLADVLCDRVFTDRVSGRSIDRPQLDALLHYVREDVTVVVHSMDRLARNLEDLRRLVREFTGRGIHVQFVKENLVFTGEDTPMATLLLSVMGAMAEFERALIRERQREGIALAKKRGVYQGRQWALTAEEAEDLRRQAAAGATKSELARAFGIGRASVSSYLKRPEAGSPQRPPHT